MADPKADSPPADFAALAAAAWQEVGIGFCLSDAAGTIRSVNPAFCTLTGYEPAELVGATLVRLHPAEAGFSAAADHAAIIAGRTPPASPPLVHKSGCELFVQLANRRIAGPDGQAWRVTTAVDLEGELTRDVRLEQLQRAESFLASATALSNDYNNLLAIILGYTAFLQDGAVDARRIQTAVHGIDNAVQRAADLVRQSLYLTRQAAPALQRIHLNVLVEELARTLEGHDGWTPQVELMTGDLPGSAGLDPKHLAYVVNELGRRAYESMGRGFRVQLLTALTPGVELRERFASAREPHYARLEIQLAPGSAARRGSRTPWDHHRRDLSLAAIESIMAGHRGCVEREALGDGVVFRLYFPVLPDPVAPAPVATGVVPTVLVVDDEDSLLHALGFALERHGFRVLKARDGAEAVETFERHAAEISIVLCDLGLPRMSGWEAFLRMRQIRADVRVVLMTGQLGHALEEEINRSGAAGFLQKPFAVQDAVAEVRAKLVVG